MRRFCNYRILVLACAMVMPLPDCRAAATAPLAEKYLLDGKLAEGAKALQGRLKEEPKDDQARFGLGVLQFLQTFEHLGGNLYKYGLRTEKSFLRPPPPIKEFLPQNPHPDKLTYTAARRIVQTFLDDLVKAEATLAEVKDPAVKLPLHVGRIRIDPFGQDKPISAAFLFGRVAASPAGAHQQAEKLVIGFDRGDVSWLRGYCHLLAAWTELLLAVDGQNAFECGAHLLFEKVETPHTFLLENRLAFDEAGRTDVPLWSDVVSFFHQLTRLPVKEPARTKSALKHLEAGVAQAKEMWKFILAEKDDDNEWIPNPKQTGVLGVPVTQEIVDAWRETLDEAEQVLQGKKLIPFWRGKSGERGVNLRAVFTQPRTFDPIEWVQGTAATPYLEKGTLTKLADPRVGQRLNKAFGGPLNFIGFGFWFN
ncbi:MAG TPA: hypothetical protein VN688_30710 [Gemmataceae bacterium]|nr:hypothetical protein [Gemmataceae bacterium]